MLASNRVVSIPPPFPSVEHSQNANEQLLAGIVGSAMDAIITIDDDHRVVLFNPAAETMFHCHAEDALGKPVTPFLPERFRANHSQLINHFMRGGHSKHRMHSAVEVMGRRFTGEEFPIEASISTMVIEGCTFNTVILRDITERVQADAALQASETQMRAMADAMPQMVFVIDRYGQFEYLNQHVRDALGDTLLSHWWSIVPAGDRQQLVKRWHNCLRTGQQFQQMHRIYNCSTGTTRWFLSRALPIQDENGQIHHWYGTATDIDDQKSIERELARTSKLLQAVLNGASEGIFVKDRQGRYLLANAALANFLGLTPDQSLGNDDPAIFPAKDAARLRQEDAKLIAEEKVQTVETDLITVCGIKSFLGTKSPLVSEDGTVIGLIGILHDITERKHAEEAQRENERRLQMALNAAQMGVWEWNPVSRSLYLSPECFAIFGKERCSHEKPVTHLVKDFFQMVHPDDRERLQQTIFGAVRKQQDYVAEYRCVRDSGEIRWLLEHGHTVVDHKQQLQRVVGVIQDITERIHLEEQLRQAQKMEAIGQLAGGIAHDFNNLLTVINGYCNLLLAKLSTEDPNRGFLQNIHHAGEQAAALTRQLLTFSRKQILEPKRVDLHDIIAEIEMMLQRLIGEDITLMTHLSAVHHQIIVDPHQIEQVVMNLTINARDAMPQGGKLSVETRNVMLDEQYCTLHTDVQPGNYVLLAVTDTGIGMSPETKQRIFEPFFTTKEIGKGTGIGLATVFGIIQQSNGHIHVYSEVGMGSSFQIYLPVAADQKLKPPASENTPNDDGSETILLVEDEEAVRTITKLALEEKGYHVIIACNGADALQVAQNYSQSIQLLITDVIMPEISGATLVQLIRNKLPDLPILYMSGYTDNAVVQQNLLHEACFFISKPFSPTALAQKVREALNSRSRPPRIAQHSTT